MEIIMEIDHNIHALLFNCLSYYLDIIMPWMEHELAVSKKII